VRRSAPTGDSEPARPRSPGGLTLRTRLGLVEAESARLGDRLLEAIISVPRLPAPASAPDRGTAAALLGLAPETIVRDPAGWQTGQPFTFVALADRDALARAALDVAAWNALRDEPWVACFYLYTMADRHDGDTIHARMFGPGVGIAEDPATGGAASAFAGLLCDREEKPDGAWTWTIHQGVEMGRPSRIGLEVETRGGRPAAVRLRGTAVPMTKGVLSL
jgi:trans-2,3-dihydro-3-hydroxyanthranilate isomerase